MSISTWYPGDIVREELASGNLKRLALDVGAERHIDLYLIFADRDYASPALRRLAALLRDVVTTKKGTEAIKST